MLYVESSLLLEVYLGQPRAALAQSVLAVPRSRVSSRLLSVEVPIVLRRTLAALPDAEAAVTTRLGWFDADSSALSFHEALDLIAKRVRSDARLTQCRALDAIHVATALVTQEGTDRPVIMGSLDGRVRTVARSVGLLVEPALAEELV